MYVFYIALFNRVIKCSIRWLLVSELEWQWNLEISKYSEIAFVEENIILSFVMLS